MYVKYNFESNIALAGYMAIVMDCLEYLVTIVLGVGVLEEKEEQTSSEPNSLCKNPDLKVGLVEQGTSRGSESEPSLSPYKETLAQGKINVKPYRRVMLEVRPSHA